MPEYWFVVKSTNEALYDALRSVLESRPGFHIVRDRRSIPGVGPEGERRISIVWEGDDLAIAETSQRGE